MSESPAFTFYFPYREVSGVPMLFSRLAAHLAGRGHDIRVVDYPDGAMASRLKGNPDVRIVPFEDGRELAINDDSILVMQSILPATIRTELAIGSAVKMLFWTLHPANFIQTAIPTPFFRHLQIDHPWFHHLVMRTAMRGFSRRLAAFVADLSRRHALLFMDGENYKVTCDRVGVDIPNPVFVPVASESVSRNRAAERPVVSDEVLRLGWIGRLADFKIHILLHTLERLSRIARERRMPMRVEVIGDGPEAGRIRLQDFEHEFFDLLLVGTVKSTELDDYILQRLDTVVAMGTSALEGARLGVPTILLDFSYGPIRGDYIFRWLHEAKFFNLGEVIGAEHIEKGNRSLERLIDDVLANRSEVSAKVFEYYRSHHAVDAVADRFLEEAPRTQLTYGDIDPGLLRKGMIRRLYESVRTQFSHPRHARRVESAS